MRCEFQLAWGGGVCLYAGFLSAVEKTILRSLGTYEVNTHDIVRAASVSFFFFYDPI